MTNPAFLVEGHMEQKIVRSICPKKPVKLINCNGDNVAISRVVDFIETHLRLFNNKYYPVFIILDREGREESSEQIKEQILTELSNRGFEDDTFVVGIPDRCTENWILSGKPDLIEYGSKKTFKPKEGTKGKGELKRQLGATTYSETQEGFDLFMKCSFHEMINNSESFNDFVNQATGVDCWWLNQT